MRGAAAALLLGGCAPLRAIDPLPDSVAAVVALSEGGYASVLVEMRREVRGPGVRLSPGVLALGPGWAHAVSLSSPSARPPQVHVLDLVGGGQAGAELSAPLRIVSVGPDGEVQIASTAGTLTLDPRRRSGGGGAPRGVEADRAGPGQGFHLRVREGQLELMRPRGAPWTPVLEGVSALLGAWWLTSADLPDAERAVVQAHFKQVGPFPLEPGEAAVDGDLSEWADASALPVDDPSQVLDGMAWWEGPRDAAFGVAARWNDQGVVLAVRVVDDAPGQVGDALEILLEDRTIALPLVPGPAAGAGWRAVVAAPGQVEIALADAAALRSRPPVVHLRDADPGQGELRLGTAPDARLGGLACAEPVSGEGRAGAPPAR